MAQQQRTPVEQPIPSHLPSPWPDPQAYNDLYREVNPYQDYSENQGNWQEIRISPGNSAEQVYRRLPSDLDRVLGGYLTRTRIRYAGDPHRVWVGFPSDKVSEETRIGEVGAGHKHRDFRLMYHQTANSTHLLESISLGSSATAFRL